MVLNKNIKKLTPSLYKPGFTLIELLVVIAIIGILSTLAVVALSNARAKARDSKRVADIQQISKALALYYTDNNSYPVIITPGDSLKSPDGNTTYMANIPSNPTPRTDNNCPDTNYGYTYVTSTNTYYLSSCLGNNSGSLTAGGITLKPDAPLTNDVLYGLVGWWKFDEGSGNTAIDSSGNNNNGTWAVNGAYATGKSGMAGQLNGSDNYINVGNPSSGILNFGTNNFTISAWVKTTDSTSEKNIVSKGPAACGNCGAGYELWARAGNGVQFVLSNATSNGQNYSGFNYSDGNWHYLVGVREGTNITVFIDEGPPISGAISLLDVTSTTGLTIGGRSSSYLFNGLIDDVRIYNRALSAAEVSILYNSTK